MTGYSYIPGEFWPVNRAGSAKLKDALFCVNERLVNYLDTPVGRCAVVKVGATCVSRIKASYSEVLTHQGKPAQTVTLEQPIALGKGDEIGMFEMGSTVILLFQPGKVTWDEGKLVPDAVLKMGERIGVGK